MSCGDDILKWANSVLREASCLHKENKTPALHPAVFIVGVPRSGTTLLHQLLVNRLQVGYIDNLIARFWGCPHVGIKLSKELIPEHDRISLQYTSDLGRTPGLAGPHEFGYFWNYWFGFNEEEPHKLSEQRRTGVDIDGLGRTLADMQLMFGLPLAFKNLTCGLQAELLWQAYPKALFVYVERDPIEVGRSILAARKRFHGSYQAWWSIKPAGWPENVPDRGPASEVAWQVMETARQTMESLSCVNFIKVNYNGLLADPESVIMRIAYSIRAAGGGFVTTRGKPLRPLEHPLPTNIPTEMLNDLRKYLGR